MPVCLGLHVLVGPRRVPMGMLSALVAVAQLTHPTSCPRLGASNASPSVCGEVHTSDDLDCARQVAEASDPRLAISHTGHVHWTLLRCSGTPPHLLAPPPPPRRASRQETGRRTGPDQCQTHFCEQHSLQARSRNGCEDIHFLEACSGGSTQPILGGVWILHF